MRRVSVPLEELLSAMSGTGRFGEHYQGLSAAVWRWCGGVTMDEIDVFVEGLILSGRLVDQREQLTTRTRLLYWAGEEGASESKV